jgi:hypothetical protein
MTFQEREKALKIRQEMCKTGREKAIDNIKVEEEEGASEKMSYTEKHAHAAGKRDD